MIKVDYSDSTPDITYTYTRIGLKKTVTDAAGTHTFTYNDKLQLTSEQIDYIVNSTTVFSKTISYTYDTYGRRSSLSVDDGYSVTYTYDEYGRMKTINTGGDTFTYNYLQNSNLIASIDYPHNIKVTTAYEPNRDLILSVENKYASTVISKYSYINDALGRRVSMEKSGAAFAASDTITYGYNTRNEVISAVSANNNLYNYAYNFDTIGNRITASLAGNSLSYTTNNLNQYTQITSCQTTIQPTTATTPPNSEDG